MDRSASKRMWIIGALLGLAMLGVAGGVKAASGPGPAMPKVERAKAIELAKGMVPGQVLSTVLGLSADNKAVWLVTILPAGAQATTVVTIDGADGHRRP